MTKKKITEAKDVYVSGDFIAGDQINNYYTGDFASLAEYYISPESVFQRVRTEEFIGRDWLTAKVDSFLNDPNRKSGAFLLIGDAGVGKTSFMAHLVKERRYLHLFAEQAPGQAMLQRAMQSLGSQLVTRYQIDPYKDRDTLNALSVFPDFLERILRLAASTLTEGEKIVIVCDALDEAGVFPDHFVFGLPKELPDSVYFILSQRPVNVKLPNFEPVVENLEAQGEGNLNDMQDYLSAVAKRPVVAAQIRSKEYSEEFFIQTLKEKSQGVWMYLHYIIKEIESGARAPLDLANLPTGLAGYYAEYWDAWRTGKRGKGEEAWDELYAPLLTTLAAAQEAIPVDWLIQWADVTAKPREVTRLLTENWRAFITEKEKDGKKTYTPYHLSLKDFITGRVETDKLPPAQANLVKDIAAQTIDAHKRIVSAFEKECNGEWEKLVEQDYPRLYLTSHLNGAGEFEKLQFLLTEGDEKIKWAEAREKKEETYAWYLNDLTYVWDYAEKKQNYELAIRSMLIENSIHSLASNVLPELLVRLGENGLWSYHRCLFKIRDISNPNDQVKALGIIAPNLPQALHNEAFELARTIHDESAIALVLVSLTPYFNNDLKSQAIEVICAIQDEYDRANALASITPYLNDEQRFQVFKSMCVIQDEVGVAIVLSALAPYINDELKSQALEMVHAFQDEAARSFALTSLAPYLNKELKSQTIQSGLESAYTILDANDRALALIDIMPYLNEHQKIQALQEGLEATYKIQDENNRTKTLVTFAPHLDKEQISQVFKKVCAYHDEAARASALMELAPYLSENQRYQMLEIAHSFKNDIYLSATLSVLAPYQTAEIKYKAFELACSIQRELDRASALEALTPYLSPDQKSYALKMACDIQDNSARSFALTALIPHLDGKQRNQALQAGLEATQAIQHANIRLRALTDIAPFINKKEERSQVIQEALEIMHTIKDGLFRSDAFVSLAPHLDKQQKLQALQVWLEAACTIHDESALASLLAKLSPHINKQKSKVIRAWFEAVCTIHNEHDRANALWDIVSHLNMNQKSQVFDLVYYSQDDLARTHALQALIPYLKEKQKSKAFESICEIQDEYERINALASLVPYLNNEQKSRVIKVVCNYQDESFFAGVLTSLMPHLNNKQKSQVLKVAYAVKDEYVRARILVNLAPYLDEKQKSQTLEVVRAIEDDYARASAISTFTSRLDEKQKYQALEMACAIQDENERASALRTLAPHLDTTQKYQAIKIACSIQNESERASILIDIALNLDLDKDMKLEALQAGLDEACDIKDGYIRGRTLADLAPHLNEKQISQALGAACSTQKEIDRANALVILAPYLDEEKITRALEEAFAIQDQHTRAFALRHLASYLSDEEVKSQLLLETHEEVSETRYDDILSDELMTQIPLLDEEFLDWEDDRHKLMLEELIPFFKFTSQKERKSGYEVLGALTPALIHFRGPAIADELYRTITDVTRWWP